jgi:hypothetical protein
LIEPNSNQWNHNTIDNLFLSFEANQIYKIPLVDTSTRDDITWGSSKDGNYSVKSSYHTVMQWKDIDKMQAGSITNQKDPTWTHIWKLKLPPKYSHLIWRILNHVVPVRNDLTT